MLFYRMCEGGIHTENISCLTRKNQVQRNSNPVRGYQILTITRSVLLLRHWKIVQGYRFKIFNRRLRHLSYLAWMRLFHRWRRWWKMKIINGAVWSISIYSRKCDTKGEKRGESYRKFSNKYDDMTLVTV